MAGVTLEELHGRIVLIWIEDNLECVKKSDRKGLPEGHCLCHSRLAIAIMTANVVIATIDACIAFWPTIFQYNALKDWLRNNSAGKEIVPTRATRLARIFRPRATGHYRYFYSYWVVCVLDRKTEEVYYLALFNRVRRDRVSGILKQCQVDRTWY